MKTLLLFLGLVSVSWAGTYTVRLRHMTNMGGQLGSVQFRAGQSLYQVSNGYGTIYDAGVQSFSGGDVIVTVPDETLRAWQIYWRDVWGGMVSQSQLEFDSIPVGDAKEAYLKETGTIVTGTDRGEITTPPIEDPPAGGGAPVSVSVEVPGELTIEEELQLFFLGFGCALPMLAVSYTLTMARRARQLDGGAS